MLKDVFGITYTIFGASSILWTRCERWQTSRVSFWSIFCEITNVVVITDQIGSRKSCWMKKFSYFGAPNFTVVIFIAKKKISLLKHIPPELLQQCKLQIHLSFGQWMWICKPEVFNSEFDVIEIFLEKKIYTTSVVN